MSTLAADVYLCFGAISGCQAEARGGGQKSSLTNDVCMEGHHRTLDYISLCIA